MKQTDILIRTQIDKIRKLSAIERQRTVSTYLNNVIKILILARKSGESEYALMFKEELNNSLRNRGHYDHNEIEQILMVMLNSYERYDETAYNDIRECIEIIREERKKIPSQGIPILPLQPGISQYQPQYQPHYSSFEPVRPVDEPGYVSAIPLRKRYARHMSQSLEQYSYSQDVLIPQYPQNPIHTLIGNVPYSIDIKKGFVRRRHDVKNKCKTKDEESR